MKVRKRADERAEGPTPHFSLIHRHVLSTALHQDTKHESTPTITNKHIYVQTNKNKSQQAIGLVE